MTTVILDDDVAVVKSTPTEISVEEQINTQVVTTVEDEFNVVTVSDVSIVKSIDPTSSVVATGLQGPTGPQGPKGDTGDPGTGSTVDIQLPTNSVISGWKVIRASNLGFAEYASSDQPSHADTILGISTHSVTDNSLVNVRCSGYMTDNAWSWAPGKLYLGLNGNITQSLPGSGLIQQIGNVLSPNEININIKTSIILS